MIETYGPQLIARGYAITPIRRHSKAPLLPGWQKTPFPLSAVPRYVGCGVGIVCGVGAAPVAAIDIDSRDADFAEWCERWWLEHAGDTVVRVGQWPKRLLLYRWETAGRRKVTGPQWECLMGYTHRVELLGAGQQCVAYGVHPETGREYEWTDLWGGAATTPAAELPVIGAALLARWSTAEVEGAALCGLTLKAPPGGTSIGADASRDSAGEGSPTELRDPLQNYAPPLGLSIADARRLVAWAGDPANYDQWLTLGMALHHESAGWGDDGAEGLGLWDEWSAGSINYVGFEDLARRWEGFGRSVAGGARPVTMKYLIRAANVASGAVAAEKSVDAVSRVGVSADEAIDTGVDAGWVADGRYPRTEAGNAARLVDAWGRDLLWCAELGCWYRWSGKHWRAVSLTEVRALAKGAVEAMRDDVDRCVTDKDKADHMRWCASSQRWAMYDHMVSIAALDSRLWVRAAELDGDLRYLGVQNGVVDLWTGDLLPPDRARRVTRLARVDYVPGAKCQLFEATVRDVFESDSEMPGFFQRLCGYSITGDPREHVLVLPFGGGGNGKGTLLNAIQWALGAHATTGHSSSFVRAEEGGGGGNGAARPDLIALAGVRFVLVSEPPKGAELREDVIKAMAGGDVLPARALYSGTMFQIQPSWTVWISTNHKPVIKGEDNGIWRRVLPVPFLRSFDGDPAKDVTRPERLKAEAEGVLAWLVRGAVEYRRVGLCVPSTVSASRAEYRADMDLIGDWLAERCVLGGGASVSLDALWLDWEPWSRIRGELRYVTSRKALAKKLEAKGFAKERSTKGMAFFGLNLRNNTISEV